MISCHFWYIENISPTMCNIHRQPDNYSYSCIFRYWADIHHSILHQGDRLFIHGIKALLLVSCISCNCRNHSFIFQFCEISIIRIFGTDKGCLQSSFSQNHLIYSGLVRDCSWQAEMVQWRQRNVIDFYGDAKETISNYYSKRESVCPGCVYQVSLLGI